MGAGRNARGSQIQVHLSAKYEGGLFRNRVRT